MADTTKQTADQSFFIFVKDTNTGKIRRMAIPGDVQIGLQGNPAELQLLGRLSLAARDYSITAVNKGILYVPNDDTIISVTVVDTPPTGRITLYLPANPRNGQLHFIKDMSGTADSVPIDIVPSPGALIDQYASRTLTDKYGSIALYWFGDRWRILVSGVGLTNIGSAPLDATYVTLSGNAGLTTERRLNLSGTNLTMTDQGPNASVILDLSTILGAGAGTFTYTTLTVDAFGRVTAASSGVAPPPVNASYITVTNEPGLTGERALAVGTGLLLTDGGANGTITTAINNNIVATLTGSIFTGPLSGSIQRTSTGVSYLVAGPGVTILTQSNGQIVIGTPWTDGGNKIFTTSSVSIDSQGRFADAIGTDTYFFVSGTRGINSGTANARRIAVFGGDVRISGSLTVGTGSATLTDNDLQFGGFGTRIERQGADMKFFDTNNPTGRTLTSMGTGGSGGGADVSASYITIGNTGSLPNERALAAGTGISFVDSGPGGTLTINSTGGGGSSVGSGTSAPIGTVTSSLSVFTNIPTTPTWATLCAITSSFTDMEFFGGITGLGAGANTVWVRLLVDGLSPRNKGNTATFIETVNSGAGFGGGIQGRVTGLTPGTHFFDLQVTKGSAANTPAIDPNDGLNQQGASLMLMNLTASTVNVQTLGGGFQQANYAFVTSSNQWTVPAGSTFVGEPVLTASITTTGSPVFINVNANYTAQSGTPTGIFSLARNGVNLGHTQWGMKPSGPLGNSFNDNVSIQFVDFPPAGTYSYSFIGCNPTGSGFLTAYGAGPASILAFEMKGANVVTASMMTEVSVPGGNVTGLSASITPTKGPVLAIASLTQAGDLAVNWAHGTIARNGTNLAGATSEVLTVNSQAGEANCFNMMFLDQGATIGGSNTYNVQATQGAGTGKIGKNNSLSTLILWEIPDVNFKYATSNATTALAGTYTDVVPSTPSLLLSTRGRPVLMGWAGQINTTSTTGRSGWSFLRNGTSITTSSKGFQIVDGEGSNDWNRVPSMFWLDQVSAGSYQYQVAGFNISGSQAMNQSPAGFDAFFVYELDAGATAGVLAGGWLDTGNKLSTTASVAISNGTENITDPSTKGRDVYLYVSGTIGVSTASNPQNARVALFGGDVRVSGSLRVGSGSVEITSNDVKFGDSGVRISRVGNELKFFDSNNASGQVLAGLVGGGGVGSTEGSTSKWVTPYEVNFKTLTPTAFGANGQRVLGGVPWTVENFAAADAIGVNAQTGLEFDANATSTDYGFAVRSAPLLFARLSDIYPDFSLPDHRFRVWAYISQHNVDQDFEKIFLGLERSGSVGDWCHVMHRMFATSVAGWSIQASAGGSGILNQAAVASDAAHNVIMLQYNGIRNVDFYTGPAINGNWPSTSSLRHRGNVQLSNSALFVPTNLTGSSDIGVTLGVATNNTNNNLTGSFWKFKFDYEVTSSIVGGGGRVTSSVNGFIARYTPPDANVIHQWRLNESSGSTFANAVSGGVNMSLDNSLTPGTPILVGLNSLFEGGAVKTRNNNNSIYTANTGVIAPPSQSLGLDCWIRPDSAGTNGYIFGRQWKDPQDATNYSAISLATAGNGTLGYWLTTNGGTETGAYAKVTYGASGNDAWRHVGLTYDGANVRLYVDGDNVFTEARTGDVDFRFSAPWFVSNLKTPTTSRPFSGKIADCRVHNSVRPESYFRSVYNLGVGLASGSVGASTTTSGSTFRYMPISSSHIVVWKFNDVTGSTSVVNSGTALTGTLSAVGRVDFGRAGLFETDASMPLTTFAALNGAAGLIPAGNRVTLSCWVFPVSFPTSTNYGRIITKWYGPTFTSPFETVAIVLNNTADGQWYGQYTIGGTLYNTTGGGAVGASMVGDRLRLNQWNHIGLSFNNDGGTTIVKLFLNGNQVQQYTQSPAGNLDFNANGNWIINCPSSSISQYTAFAGEVDDYRIINEALSGSWFQETYKRGIGTYDL